MTIDAVKIKTSQTAGKNHALSFDGKDDYVYIREIKYEPNQPITIEARVKLSASATGIGVILHTHISGGPTFFFDETGALTKTERAWNFRYPGQKDDFSSPKNSANPNRWTHLAEVWDGNQCFFFVDGKRVASTETKKAPWPQSFDAYIGTHYGLSHQSGLSFYGLIDEVRVSKTARYTKNFTPAKRFTPDKDTLALYHFDEGTGDVLKDSFGNGHHGKIIGAKWVDADGSATDAVGKN